MNSCGRRNKTMSKDEYLITDAPLKALTVFAMPMILGGFYYRRSVCWLLCTCGSWCLCCTYECLYLYSIGCRCRCRCACESLFWSQRLQQNENNRVNITDQFPDSKYTSGCLWLLLFPFDDEVITDTC